MTVYKYFTKLCLGQALGGNSGVRAFLPVFIAALAHAIDPDMVPLSANMKWLAHPASLSITGTLAVLEAAANFVPGIDHILHAVRSGRGRRRTTVRAPDDSSFRLPIRRRC